MAGNRRSLRLRSKSTAGFAQVQPGELGGAWPLAGRGLMLGRGTSNLNRASRRGAVGLIFIMDVPAAGGVEHVEVTDPEIGRSGRTCGALQVDRTK